MSFFPKGHRAVARLGLPGSGKTLAQTVDDILPALEAGDNVYCCYWLNWSGDNYHYFPPTYEGWQSIKDKTNCVIAIDEIAQVAHPRAWQQEGDDWVSFWQLHRHRHQDVYVNTQDVSLIAKSAGIVISDWLLYYKDEPGLFLRLLYWVLGISSNIRSRVYTLTWARLKKLSSTNELGDEYSPDDDLLSYASYSLFDLYRPDLDYMKIELIHSYCPKCQQRQGAQILSENTDFVAYYDLKQNAWLWLDLSSVPLCPYHSVPLELRDSAMFDTDYLPEVPQNEIFVKYYKEVLYKKLVPVSSPSDI